MTVTTECNLTKVGLIFDQTKGYAHRMHCVNCSEFDTVYIPYGQRIKEYLEIKECPRCKCKGVLY